MIFIPFPGPVLCMYARQFLRSGSLLHLHKSRQADNHLTYFLGPEILVGPLKELVWIIRTLSHILPYILLKERATQLRTCWRNKTFSPTRRFNEN